MLNKLLQTSVDEIKNGYTRLSEDQVYTCLVCGQRYAVGEVFSFDGKFYDAEKAVQQHVEQEHGDMMEVLTSFSKKFTGLTRNQIEVMMMMYQGLSDQTIAKQTGLAPATIRQQRFILREKAKQAKVYLAIFELFEKAASDKKTRSSDDEMISIHPTATMIDERYYMTRAEEEKILSMSFESMDPLILRVFPPKEKRKLAILRRIIQEFEKERIYSEKEINAVLKPIYADYVTIRRYLIEYGFMDRTTDCREYWLK